MSHPYRDLPDSAFWRRAVAGVAEPEVDPVTLAPFRIGRETPIAPLGSCFAQHISRVLAERGYTYLITEPAPEGDPDPQSYGVFPARTGNIYTVRQLLQTFLRAYGLFRPADVAWRREDGALVDPFRPQVRAAGFESLGALETDRKRHLAAVRAMFEDCEVLIFTLGLTEAWISARDGAVVPLAPGVAGGEPGPDYGFHNMGVEEMAADLRDFIRRLRV
ncbi:MAG TPA: GSCFA domain-containing protein, partial [Caulobacteraceae bacterium]|nr:GSCFA domain-containing protein [Caulobacteraceae bacterium]